MAVEGSFQPIAALAGAGAVSYAPQRRPARCGFGAWEVHPNRVQVTRADGAMALEWNGEYLAVGEIRDDAGDLHPYQLACAGVAPFVAPAGMSARDMAERICVSQNDGKPTRVVDHVGHESTSSHSLASVASEMARAERRDLGI